MIHYTEGEGALVRALGRQLAAERVGAGLTQEELGRQVGVSRKSIVRYEAGERDVSFRTLGDIARALGLRASGIMLAAEERAAREASETPDSGDA